MTDRPRTDQRVTAQRGSEPAPGWHLAQLNIATLAAPIDSVQLADFVAGLEPVNALADAAPGFVWRLQEATGDATALRPWGADVIVNLSVWESLESLRAYVFAPGHVEVLRRRREWFVPMVTPHLVLWWVPAGHRPGLEEAGDRLARLAADGPTSAAFTLRAAFSAPAPGSPA